MSDANPLIAMERAAVDRWGVGDPRGYLKIMAPDVTYLDPVQERRVDGLRAITALLESWTGKIRVDRYDMVSPMVQQHTDAAVLTFNLVSYRRRRADETEHVIAHWNATEVYARVNAGWTIVHSHWSFVKPKLKQSVSEEA
jgi:ketosteroid isomerase-like protein